MNANNALQHRDTLLKDLFSNIPENINDLRFDVGTSHCAQNSAIWLYNRNDVFVVGVEPNIENVQLLYERPTYPDYRVVSLKYNAIAFRGQRIANIHNRYKLLNCALDNVPEPCYQKFYMTDERNTGCSSLLKPTEKLNKVGVKMETEVLTIGFNEILKLVPWDRFEYIDIVKIDAQGKDLEILKSAEEYLDRIKVLHVETTTWGSYENACEPQDIKNYLHSKGFAYLFGIVNETYLNTRFLNEYSSQDKIDALVKEFRAE